MSGGAEGHRTERSDFRATTDPALDEAAEVGVLDASGMAGRLATWRASSAICADPRHGEAIQRTLVEVGPLAEGVLRPAWIPEGQEDVEFHGATVNETRAFALKALERRLKTVGLAAVA